MDKEDRFSLKKLFERGLILKQRPKFLTKKWRNLYTLYIYIYLDEICCSPDQDLLPTFHASEQ